MPTGVNAAARLRPRTDVHATFHGHVGFKKLRKQKPCLSMTPPLLLGVCLALALVSSTLAQSVSPTATVTVSPTVSPSPTVTTDTDADGVVDALDRCPATAVSAAPWNRCVDGVGRGWVCVRVRGAIRWHRAVEYSA